MQIPGYYFDAEKKRYFKGKAPTASIPEPEKVYSIKSYKSRVLQKYQIQALTPMQTSILHQASFRPDQLRKCESSKFWVLQDQLISAKDNYLIVEDREIFIDASPIQCCIQSDFIFNLLCDSSVMQVDLNSLKSKTVFTFPVGATCFAMLSDLLVVGVEGIGLICSNRKRIPFKSDIFALESIGMRAVLVGFRNGSVRLIDPREDTKGLLLCETESVIGNIKSADGDKFVVSCRNEKLFLMDARMPKKQLILYDNLGHSYSQWHDK